MELTVVKRVGRAMIALAVSSVAVVATPAAAAAVPALSGYQSLAGRPVDVPPGGSVATYAQCPSGTHVVGGGMQADSGANPNAVLWRSSYPSHRDGYDRWGVQVHNRGQLAFAVQPYAICLGGLTAYQVAYATHDRPPAPHDNFSAFTGCARTSFATLGGGFDVETGWGFAVAGVHWFQTDFGEHRGVSGSNTSSVVQRWAAYAVCGAGGMAEVRTVRRATEIHGPGVVLLRTNCPSGWAVLGGGGAGQNLLSSYPSGQGSWEVVVRIDDPAGRQTEGWAACAR